MNIKYSRAFALLNASTVWQWASTFGHGSIIELTTYTTEVELSVHFPYDKFEKEREFERFKQVMAAGAEVEWINCPHLRMWDLHIRSFRAVRRPAG